jgi:hypothetical protein
VVLAAFITPNDSVIKTLKGELSKTIGGVATTTDLVTVQRLLPQWADRILLALWYPARREVKDRWLRRSV